jgi:hypothetical protein
MRWICLIVSIAGFALAFTTKSPGLLGLGLLLGVGALIGFTLAWAAARIAASAQPLGVLIVDPEVNALRSKARQAKAQTSTDAVGTAASSPLGNDPN